MKILITGGSGYLGRMVLDSLSHSQHILRTLISETSEKEINDIANVEIIKGDILSESDLDKACKGIDIIIHLAAVDVNACKEHPDKGIMVNAIGTRKLLCSASKNSVKKFIYISTFHVYGQSEGIIDENSNTTPKSDYAISKLAGEYYCRAFSENMKYTILRLSNVIGYSKSKNGNTLVLNDLTQQCINNKELILKTAGGQKRNFVSINDVISAINIVIDTSKKTDNQIFNVGGKENLSIYELAKTVSEKYKKMYNTEVKITITAKPSVNNPKKHDAALNFKFNKITKLGYKPIYSIDKEIENIFISIKKDTISRKPR